MYIGIGPEEGKKVSVVDAFSYACDRCKTGDEEMQKTFLEIAKESSSMKEFAHELVDWFYSGNWYSEPDKSMAKNHFVRFSDGSIACHGKDVGHVIEMANEKALKSGLTYLVL